jgi:hypothetical protein
MVEDSHHAQHARDMQSFWLGPSAVSGQAPGFAPNHEPYLGPGGNDPSRKGLWPQTRPDLVSPGLGDQPLSALQGASAQNDRRNVPLRGQFRCVSVPREPPCSLHTPVSPTGRGSDALNLNPKGDQGYDPNIKPL